MAVINTIFGAPVNALSNKEITLKFISSHKKYFNCIGSVQLKIFNFSAQCYWPYPIDVH